MKHETPKSESLRLTKEQAKTLEDEVFGGLSLSERKEYDRKTQRINELEIRIQASAVAKANEQSAKTNQRRRWSKKSEPDGHQNEAHQPYRDRDRDSGHSQKRSKRKNKMNAKTGITNEE